MSWNKHSNLEGTHALLSPSQPSWWNYDIEKLDEFYSNFDAKERGTRHHLLASLLIKEGWTLEEAPPAVVNFVRDAKLFKLDSEVVLFGSKWCYGTADAISFRKNLLRISDLKTGKTKPHMEQLMTYAALYCMEYKKNPHKIKIELRIYQGNNIDLLEPDPDVIARTMQWIKTCSEHLDALTQQ